MKQQDRDLIEVIGIEEVPWNRMGTPLGRAAEFSELLEAITDSDQETAEEAADILAKSIETESVLWQPTPWVMLFLARILGCAAESYIENHTDDDAGVIMRILTLYALVFNTLEGIDDDVPKQVPTLQEMLDAKNLLPEKTADKDDEIVIGEFYKNVPEEMFYGYFYYSWSILAQSLSQDLIRLKNAPDAEIAEACLLFTESPLYEDLQRLTQ